MFTQETKFATQPRNKYPTLMPYYYKERLKRGPAISFPRIHMTMQRTGGARNE